MPELMRFWELVSAFRSWPDLLREVLASEKWRDYFALYERYNELVERHDREVLDEQVPLELSREVAIRCPQNFAYDPASRVLRCAWPNAPASAHLVEMTACEVHDQFGGSAIEEVFERGSACIPRAL